MGLCESDRDHTSTLRNVLVIDDNPAIVKALATRLMAMGWGCMTALDGYDAMALMAKHPVDAVVTDLDMPYIDGFGILELASSFNGCPVMVMTGSPDAAQRCREDFPNVPVLHKPFTSQQVLSWLESLAPKADTQSAA